MFSCNKIVGCPLYDSLSSRYFYSYLLELMFVSFWTFFLLVFQTAAVCTCMKLNRLHAHIRLSGPAAIGWHEPTILILNQFIIQSSIDATSRPVIPRYDGGGKAAETARYAAEAGSEGQGRSGPVWVLCEAAEQGRQVETGCLQF